ncbi:MAG: primosomal protein N', partial [Armatimonadota bacterium]|nr:primosomal protein N' [Armatimonadota bacterium]
GAFIHPGGALAHAVLVAVDVPLAVGDAALTYAAAEGLPPGAAVLVPLRTRLAVGYVLGPAPDGERPLRPVVAVLPDISPLPADLLELARWISNHYLCSTGEAIAAMLPPGLMRRVRVAMAVGSSLAPSRRLQALGERGVEVETLGRVLGPGAAELLRRWLAEGSVRLRVLLPQAPPAAPSSRPRRLRVHPALWTPGRETRRDVVLLGRKREGTYLAAVSDTLRRGKGVLALFASVAAVERFARRVHDVLGAEVAVLHAGLPDEARLARWLAVRRGEAMVVAGTRGAVFAPLERLGLVLVDEEADVGHREERVPRYHVREVARRRAEVAGATLLLADEVPSVETFALVGQPAVAVLRPEGSRPPRLVVVDLRRRGQAGKELSPPLVAALERTLRGGGRALLFVHRKGYAALLLCTECGHTPACSRCEVPLAYDATGQVLRCRYCRDEAPAPSVCSRCGGRVFAAQGIGTQRVARLARALRLGPVFRLDTDVVRRRGEAAALLQQFRDRGGILVGTPLVLEVEGLPAVDLAGVVLADAPLRYPDYRAPEQGLRTLWRLGGLARSWYVVQTYAPDHPALLALRRRDLRLFYREELRLRRAFRYPPYGEVLSIEVAGRDPAAREAAVVLAAIVAVEVEVLGPARLRRGRQSHWQVVFRGRTAAVRNALEAWLRHPPAGVRAAIEVNP